MTVFHSNNTFVSFLQSFGMSTLKQCASPAWNFHQTAPWLLWQAGKGPGIRTERYIVCVMISPSEIGHFHTRDGKLVSDGYPSQTSFPS